MVTSEIIGKVAVHVQLDGLRKQYKPIRGKLIQFLKKPEAIRANFKEINSM